MYAQADGERDRLAKRGRLETSIAVFLQPSA
jgi:hypothetical protein